MPVSSFTVTFLGTDRDVSAILGGSSPFDAVKYQVLIMLFIAAGTGLVSWQPSG
jgi:hypothetical protein